MVDSARRAPEDAVMERSVSAFNTKAYRAFVARLDPHRSQTDRCEAPPDDGTLRVSGSLFAGGAADHRTSSMI